LNTVRVYRFHQNFIKHAVNVGIVMETAVGYENWRSSWYLVREISPIIVGILIMTVCR